MTDIKKLHHSAYRCRDSEETRAFYEDFLGLPLINAFEINTTHTGRETRVLHSFFAMADGACLAFFEAPDRVFDFKEQQDFDLHGNRCGGEEPERGSRETGFDTRFDGRCCSLDRDRGGVEALDRRQAALGALNGEARWIGEYAADHEPWGWFTK